MDEGMRTRRPLSVSFGIETESPTRLRSECGLDKVDDSQAFPLLVLEFLQLTFESFETTSKTNDLFSMSHWRLLISPRIPVMRPWPRYSS